jgi:hypothetical protein
MTPMTTAATFERGSSKLRSIFRTSISGFSLIARAAHDKTANRKAWTYSDVAAFHLPTTIVLLFKRGFA